MTTNGSALKSPSVNGGNVQRNKLHVKTAMNFPGYTTALFHHVELVQL